MFISLKFVKEFLYNLVCAETTTTKIVRNFLEVEMTVDKCRPWRTYIVAGICFTLAALAETKARTARTKDGSEEWGYIDVRQGE